MQAEAEAATAMAAEGIDFDTGQAEAYGEQERHVADKEITGPEPMTTAR